MKIIHKTAMSVTQVEHGFNRQVNAAEATAVMHAFAVLLARRNLFSALWLAYRMRQEKKSEAAY